MRKKKEKNTDQEERRRENKENVKEKSKTVEKCSNSEQN